MLDKINMDVVITLVWLSVSTIINECWFIKKFPNIKKDYSYYISSFIGIGIVVLTGIYIIIKLLEGIV